MDHALELSPAYFVHLKGHLDRYEPHVRVLVKERRRHQLREDNSPIPGLVIDSKLLDYVEKDLQSGKNDSPLNLIRSWALLSDVHDAFNQLAYIDSRVTEQRYQSVQRHITGSVVQLTDLVD